MKEEEGKEEGWIQTTVGMTLLRVGGGVGRQGWSRKEGEEGGSL